MIAFLWEFTKVYLAMTCLVRFKKGTQEVHVGITAQNPLLSPLGGSFISNTFLEGGLIEMGG